MIIQFDATGLLSGFESVINQAVSVEGINGLLILSCDANQYTQNQMDTFLKTIDIPVFGGVFPAIVHGNEVFQKGTIVIGLSKVLEVATITDLSDQSIDYEVELDEKIPDLGNGKTMIVFVDGFAKRIGAFIESLFIVFGLDINYVGGGAGSLSMEQTPCLFTNQGLLKDCAVIALLDISSGVGVSHGWGILDGPYRVTESRHNTILSLDWRPAFQVYSETVSTHAQKTITLDDFFEVAKSYPFGIMRMGDEQIVRDPMQVSPDQHITCVGEVPEGSFVYILNGDQDSLVEAAGKAIQLGVASFPNRKTKGMVLMMDCISRVLFLKDQFELELKAVQYKDLPMVGACSLGEIANCGDEFLELYNKTNVVALLER